MDKDQFLSAALRNPTNEIIAEELHRLALPDAWLVSGCLVQTVWNVLTKRAVHYGINDYDVFYFDSDMSWEAEDNVIRRLADHLAPHGIAVEARNQARVHLWYPKKHGLPYPELRCSTQGIDRFLTKNTQIGIRRAGEGYEVYAPNGYGDVAALIVRPNPGPNFSAANYEAKAQRWKTLWPEITVLPAEGKLSQPSFRDGATAPDPESRDSGFDANASPRNDSTPITAPRPR